MVFRNIHKFFLISRSFCAWAKGVRVYVCIPPVFVARSLATSVSLLFGYSAWTRCEYRVWKSKKCSFILCTGKGNKYTDFVLFFFLCCGWSIMNLGFMQRMGAMQLHYLSRHWYWTLTLLNGLCVKGVFSLNFSWVYYPFYLLASSRAFYDYGTVGLIDS